MDEVTSYTYINFEAILKLLQCFCLIKLPTSAIVMVDRLTTMEGQKEVESTHGRRGRRSRRGREVV
jgi:hypothetical protein